MHIHRGYNYRRLHYSAHFSGTFTAFYSLGLCLKVNWCRIDSAIHTLSYRNAKSMFPTMREVFLCFFFCHSFPYPLFLQHTCSGSNLKCFFVIYTIFPEKYKFSAVWKGKGGKRWKLPRIRTYQMVFISVWASNQEMYFLGIFVLVKLKCTNVCLKVCLKSALLWMK